MQKFFSKIDVTEITDSVNYDSLTQAIIDSHETPTLFTNVDNYSMKVISGLVSSRQLLAQAIGTTPDKLSATVGAAFDEPLPLKQVDTALFMQNHISNPDIIKYLPIPTFFGGKPYLTASIVLAKDPVSGRRNASIHRMMYIRENKFAIRPVEQRDLHNFYTSTLNEGKDYLDIIIIIGIDPAFELAASTSYPDLDEFQFASKLLGGAEEVMINDIGVPTSAEIVMVGKMMRTLVEEGPFVDLTGTKDHIRMQPLVEITDLYFPNDPVFRTILPGRKEHKILMGIPQEPRMQKLITNSVKTVKNVVMTEGGGSWLHAVVQITKRTPGDGKNAIIAAFAAHPSLKRVVIVDDDVDPTDPIDVEWALATRFQADQDMVLIPGAKGSSLDPSAGPMSSTCKWGLDATKPLNTKGFDRVI